MRHVVVCGLGRFGLRVVERLRAEGVPVTVVSNPGTRQDRVARAKAAGAQYQEGDFRYEAVRRSADIADAQAVILTTADDAANLEAALEVRGEAPEVRVIMRLTEPRLGARLEADFGICAALSPSSLAAPHFAEAALAPPPAAPAGVRRMTRVRDRAARRPPSAMRNLQLLLAALFGISVVLFHQVLGMNWVDSAYFSATVMATVGFGDFNLQSAPIALKLFGIVLMFSGVVLIAMLASLLTSYIDSGAAHQARREAAARRQRRHVILCGLGTVGAAIAQDLHDRGVPVVVINDTAAGEEARTLPPGIPLVVGDATRTNTLLRAGLDQARALVAATSLDALNLEIGLTAHMLVDERRPERPLRTVLRCFDPDLANRVHTVSRDYTLLSAAKIAAPIVVAHALGKDPNA